MLAERSAALATEINANNKMMSSCQVMLVPSAFCNNNVCTVKSADLFGENVNNDHQTTAISVN